jgi:uncharacterized glyoxalase superfamily protein PhnB
MFTKYLIMIYSENPDELMKFYRDVLELKLEKKLELPNDYGYMFEVNDQFRLWIAFHNNVKGKNTDHFRHIFTLYTDEVQKWYEKVKDAKDVKIICKPVLPPTSNSTDENPRYVCTFLDPEGNCWQFLGGLGN